MMCIQFWACWFQTSAWLPLECTSPVMFSLAVAIRGSLIQKCFKICTGSLAVASCGSLQCGAVYCMADATKGQKQNIYFHLLYHEGSKRVCNADFNVHRHLKKYCTPKALMVCWSFSLRKEPCLRWNWYNVSFPCSFRLGVSLARFFWNVPFFADGCALAMLADDSWHLFGTSSWDVKRQPSM